MDNIYQFIRSFIHSLPIHPTRTASAHPASLRSLTGRRRVSLQVDVVEAGREAQVSWGDGFMLVFSLTSHSSFAALSRLRRVILELTPGAPRPMVLVGNKADLSHAREVNPDEIRDLVDCWGCDYFEVAAPEPWDVVVRPFTALYQAVLESRGT